MKTAYYSKFALVIMLLSMIVMSMAAALKGVLVPTWRSDFSVNSSTIALIFTLETAAFLVATYTGGRLIEKVGVPKVLSLALLLIAISFVVIGYSPSFVLLLCGMLGQGMGMGLIGLAVNVIVPHFPVKRPAVLMNLVHFCFGLGSAASQRLSGYLLFNQVSWRLFYPALAVAAAIIALATLKVRFPAFKEKSESSLNNKIKYRTIYLWLVVCLGFYLVSEIGTSNWFVNYMSQGYAFDSNNSSFYLSLFFILFTCGRLIGGFIVEKVSYLVAISGSLLISASLYMFGIWQGASGMVLISIAGLFQAIVFPTLMLVIAEVFSDNQALMTANITTGGYAIYLVVNFSIGVLNDNIGVATSFHIMPVSMLASVIAAIAVHRLIKQQRLKLAKDAS